MAAVDGTAARVGVTTGEWAQASCARPSANTAPPTGVAGASGARLSPQGEIAAVRAERPSAPRPSRSRRPAQALGRQAGARRPLERRRADRRAGARLPVSRSSTEGIRLTPAQIVNAAAVEEERPRRRPVDPVGLATWPWSSPTSSGWHEGRAGVSDIPVIVGGIIPDRDGEFLLAHGVSRVFTPKNFEITQMLGQIVDAIEESRA